MSFSWRLELAAWRLKLVFLILFILSVRSCELDSVLPPLIFKKLSGRMMLPSWAWYKNEYLDSFFSIVELIYFMFYCFKIMS